MLRFLLYLVMFCSWCPLLYGQENYMSVNNSVTENFMNAYQNIIKDTARIKDLLIRGSAIAEYKPDSAMHMYTEVMERSRYLNYPDGIASAMLWMGMMHMNRGDAKKALAIFQRALPYCRQAYFDKQLLAKAYNSIGLTYSNQAQYENAAWNYYKAIEEYRKNGVVNASLAQLYCNIAIVWNALKYHDLALEYMGKAIDILKKRNHPRVLANVYVNSATIYMRKGDLERAYNYALIAHKLSSKHRAFHVKLTADLILGQINLSKGHSDKAITYIKEVVDLGSAVNSIKGIEGSYLLSHAYVISNDYKKAERYLIPALEKANELNYKGNLSMVYRLLASIYAKTNRPMK